jgi:hypothetical protein
MATCRRTVTVADRAGHHCGDRQRRNWCCVRLGRRAEALARSELVSASRGHGRGAFRCVARSLRRDRHRHLVRLATSPPVASRPRAGVAPLLHGPDHPSAARREPTAMRVLRLAVHAPARGLSRSPQPGSDRACRHRRLGMNRVKGTGRSKMAAERARYKLCSATRSDIRPCNHRVACCSFRWSTAHRVLGAWANRKGRAYWGWRRRAGRPQRKVVASNE